MARKKTGSKDKTPSKEVETPEKSESETRVKTRSSPRRTRQTSASSASKSSRKSSEDSTVSTRKRKKSKTPPSKSKKVSSPSTPTDYGTGINHASRSSLAEKSKATITQVEPRDDSDALELPTKPPPTMDVSVHRLRHLGYVPKPILCLAATPFDPQACDYVATSRDNGHVELRCPDEKWRTVAMVTGLRSRTVDAMAWTYGAYSEEMSSKLDATGVTFSSAFHKSHSQTHARRTLVGASRDGTIFVLDFRTGRHLAVTGSGGGGVFSLASLYGSSSSGGQSGCSDMVAAGCEDGSVRIYKVNREQDRTKLELVSTIPCASSSILSLAWRRHSNDLQGRGMRGSVLYAGAADGTIRRYDCESALETARASGTSAHAISTGSSLLVEGRNSEAASWKSTLRMTVESYGRATPTRVWALKALSDGTVISGDSLGHVQFWDGSKGTLLESFDQNDSKADVLALAMSADECRIYASGVDSRVVCIERTPPSAGTDAPVDTRQWIMTHAQRPHTHDVKSLAVCRLQDTSGAVKPREKAGEILCSGGVDTKLCTYLMKDFRKARPKNWYPWPSVSPIAVASESRLLTMTREDRVDIHRLASIKSGVSFPVLVPEEDTLMGSIEIEGTSNLMCSAISKNGRFVALSDSSSMMLFRVTVTAERTDISRVKLPSPLRDPCTALKFASNGRLICAGVSRRIVIVRLAEGDDGVIVSLDTDLGHQPAGAALSCIRDLQISDDGNWLATSHSSLGSDAVQIYCIASGNSRRWWSLPPLGAPGSSVRFIGGESIQLAVACTNFAFYVFDVQNKQLSQWSETAGFPVSPSLPSELKHRGDYPVRFAFDAASPDRFLMVSPNGRRSACKNVITAPLYVFGGVSDCHSCKKNDSLFRPSV